MSSITYTLGGDYKANANQAATYIFPDFNIPDASDYVIIEDRDGPHDIAVSFTRQQNTYFNHLTESDGETRLNYQIAGYNFDYSDNTGGVEIKGGAFGDILRGGTADDTLSGGDGNDILEGGLGTNAIDGGAGTNNTISYEYFDTPSTEGGLEFGVFVNLASAFGGNAAGGTPNFFDSLTDVQNIRGSAYRDSLVGNTQRNALEGGGGADYIDGGGGASDVASYVHSAQGVSIDLSGATANTGGDAEGDRIIGIDNVYGSTHDDSLTGNDNANDLRGMGGADTISGMGGDDRILIKTTPSKIDGGTQTSFDILVIESGGSVTLSNDNFTGVERVNVFGGSSFDISGVTVWGDVPTLIKSLSTAATGGSTIVGTQGNDRITAGAGVDSLSGGAGNDRLYGGSGTGILSGGGDNDLLVAGSGGQEIAGGAGNDAMYGGAGADTFNEMMANFGRDRIFGADLGNDKFLLSSSFTTDTTAMHLHFAASGGGADTLVYGDAGKAADAFVLKGITATDAAAHRNAFVVDQIV